MALMLIPLILNVAAVWKSSVILTVASVAAIPMVVAVLPDSRKHENMFVFFLTAIGMIPINLKIMRMICDTGFLTHASYVSTISFWILTYWVMFNCEQIILGFISRMIWPRQYKLFHLEEITDE